jgi:site-specific DNA recombinase
MKVYDYTRKSQEDKKRQVQSFENQIDAINNITPPYGMTFEPVYDVIPQESKSGKIPLIRPFFNKMMDCIDTDLLKGEKVGIRAWQVSRLARNEIDGGRVRQAVINGLTIFDPNKVWNVNDLLYLSLEMAENSNYSLKVSFGAKTGLATKIKNGKVPRYAPIGYRNTPELLQGTREILVDELRFPIVKKCWRLLLTGKYNVNQIHKIATEEWGLTTRKGKPFSKSAMYDMFTSIFYTGKYYYYVGELHDNGTHKPMITLEEFELVQRILGARGKPFQATHEFSFTNWLMCTCGSSVSAYERFRRYCSNCKEKFNAEKNKVCPKCKGELSPNLIHTVTYACNRNRDAKCKQPSISLDNLEMQIDHILERLEMPEGYLKWGLDMLKKDNEKEITESESINQSLHTQIIGIDKRINNLAYKFTSEENLNGELYTDLEYKETKNRLKADKLKKETELAKMTTRQGTWMDNAEKAFNLVLNSRYWFEHGTKKQKRTIFQAISSNPILDNGLVKYTLLKPFLAIEKMAKLGNEINRGLEPQEKLDRTIQTEAFYSQNQELCG